MHSSNSTLIHADATEALRTIDDNSIDAVVTDPPYALENGRMAGQVSENYHESATHGRGYAANDSAEYLAFSRMWLAEAVRVLKPGGHLVAFGGNRTQHLVATAAEDVGLSIRDHLIWWHGHGAPRGLKVVDEQGAFTGQATTLRPAHESATLARKDTEGTVQQNLAKWGTGAMNIDACRAEPRRRWPGNVFEAAKPSKAERPIVGGAKHPTVKPLSLMRTLVRLVTPECGLVLDPFAGSGTTLEASLLEGRRVIGIEADAKYLPLIHLRIERSRNVA